MEGIINKEGSAIIDDVSFDQLGDLKEGAFSEFKDSTILFFLDVPLVEEYNAGRLV
jgi:hypothetical protein